MTIDVNYVLERLSTRQKESGGYYGTDITNRSKELDITPRGLRKQVSKWKRSIKEFRDLKYLGQLPPSMTLDEFMEIEARMHSNPIEVKSHVLEDIRDIRLSKGLQDLPSSTFYRARKQTDLYQFLSEAKYSWFKMKRIDIPNDYSVSDERDRLSTLFTFSNLKTYGGADLQEISNPQILSRGSHLRSLLSSIPTHQQEETQARNEMNEFYFNQDEGKRFYDLACGKTDWKYWSEKDKRALVRKTDIIRGIDLGNEDLARIMAIDRVIDENEGFLTDNKPLQGLLLR